MSRRPRLKAAASLFSAEFGSGGALRLPVGETGRVHLDRWLPFLILNRGDFGLARRIAVDSSSYLVWSPEDDLAAMAAIETVISALVARLGRVLVVTLADQPFEPRVEGSQDLPPFTAQIGAGDEGDVGRAAAVLDTALHGIEIDLRRCKVERAPFVSLLPAPIDRLLNDMEGAERLSLKVPQIHRRADGAEYPAISHDLSTEIGDALLRAACAFLDYGKSKAPHHYRSLGRSAYLAAALKADRKLDRISRSFDFLLSISPIDTAKACQRFVAEGEGKVPRFHYRPLTVDPDIGRSLAGASPGGKTP